MAETPDLPSLQPWSRCWLDTPVSDSSPTSGWSRTKPCRAASCFSGTCTDSQQHSGKDDELECPGHFADAHQDGRDNGKDVVDQECPPPANTAEPRAASSWRHRHATRSPDGTGAGAVACEEPLIPLPIRWRWVRVMRLLGCLVHSLPLFLPRPISRAGTCSSSLQALG